MSVTIHIRELTPAMESIIPCVDGCYAFKLNKTSVQFTLFQQGLLSQYFFFGDQSLEATNERMKSNAVELC